VVNSDGPGQHKIGNNKTKSSPFVIHPLFGPDRVYFQGIDDTLWVVNADGTGQHKIGNNKTKSSPFAIPLASHDEVYFQGTDDALWKVNADGTDQHKVANNKTKSRPFVILPAVGLQPASTSRAPTTSSGGSIPTAPVSSGSATRGQRRPRSCSHSPCYPTKFSSRASTTSSG
jgi:hypothetical protein